MRRCRRRRSATCKDADDRFRLVAAIATLAENNASSGFVPDRCTCGPLSAVLALLLPGRGWIHLRHLRPPHILPCFIPTFWTLARQRLSPSAVVTNCTSISR